MFSRKALQLAIALAGLAIAGSAQALPSFEQVRAAYRSSDTRLLDRHGAPLQALRTDLGALRGEWAALVEISPALRNALLWSEDKRFYEHAGVDWQAVGAVAWANLWNRRTRGASTVTMQLAGLLDPDLARPQGGRSLAAKIGQAATAIELERRWRKDQILEAYLNRVPFRGELVGISALSERLFDKLPSGLDAEQGAIAAALVRSPNAAPARVAERACDVLRHQRAAADCTALASYTAQVLARRPAARMNADEQFAPHLARLLAARAQGAPTLATTLDAGLQRFARDTLRRQLAELASRHVEDGAVIAIDNASGEVLAWVGSSGGELSRAAEVDGVLARRQAGSTLKPFLYEIALEKRWLSAASVVEDSPFGLDVGGGLYLPQDYEHDFKGRVSLRTALASSLNVPAVRTLVMVTPERFARRLVALGLPLDHGGGYYGYSLALGSAEVTLATLANAYRALANGGLASPLKLQPADPGAPRRVMDAGAAFIVADILADREARVPTFGLDNALSSTYWAAVKTGTSKDMRDNWCVGFSRRYTVGVWVGNASGGPMWDVSGISGAAPVWRAVLDELQRRDGAAAPAAAVPAGLVRQAVRFERELEPPRDEWFAAGTEQALIRLASPGGAHRRLIARPADRSIVALDPDIPPAAQKLALVPVAGVPADWSWRLDGKRLGPARATDWPLWPGLHRLELADARGRTVEAARFEVRGAQLRSPTPAPR